MKFAVAFVATLACAFASPSAYSAYSPAGYYGGYGYPAYAGSYAHYPAADIKVLPNGYLADTPEVAHAKAAHEVAKGYVAAAAAANPDYDSYYYGHGSAAPAYTPYAYGAYASYPYAAAAYPSYAKGYYAHYPAADIKVLPNGYLADTPEVAHSKAAHEVAKGYVAAAAAASPDYDSYHHATSYAYPAHIPYDSHY